MTGLWRLAIHHDERAQPSDKALRGMHVIEREKASPDKNAVRYVDNAHREEWQTVRRSMESSGLRRTRWGVKRTTGQMVTKAINSLTLLLITLFGLRSRALANSINIQLTQLDINLQGLPDALDGYAILQISDIHAGQIPGIVERAVQKIRGLSVDLAVLTGDTQSWGSPPGQVAAQEIAGLVANINAKDGIYGILGNHDSHDLVLPMEKLGVRMLVNERVNIDRDGCSIQLTGIDDVGRFFVASSEEILSAPADSSLSIALVHSPDIADVAASAGYSLYLCGHTHGGQICLPNRRPLRTCLDRHHHLASGLWKWGSMVGYTSRGVGAALAARFNCPPEIALLRLRAPPPAP